MKKLITICAVVMLMAGMACPVFAAITGNPVADGWAISGNAMANGAYVRGNANYNFEAYGASIVVQSGSALEISDGANSWLAGDTVLGAGGRFVNITAAEAGWGAFTGNAVNLLLGGTDMGADVKLQAKFGTSAASFAASTIAPNAGNGLGSFGTNGGNGAVQVRTSGWFYAADWLAGSGSLQLLNKADHIVRNGTTTPDADVARLIWNWDAVNQRVGTWQILLNASLMNRLAPGFAGPTPAAGNLSLMTVQNRDGGYTDALVIIPEPATMCLLGLGGLLLRRKK